MNSGLPAASGLLDLNLALRIAVPVRLLGRWRNHRRGCDARIDAAAHPAFSAAARTRAMNGMA